MTQTIQLRRSATATNVPTTAQLALGELAINTNDGKMFFEKDDGTPAIVELLNNDNSVLEDLSDVSFAGSPGISVGDILSYTGTGWVHTEPPRAGTIAQTIHNTIAATSGTTAIPFDDTTPLSTEGTEVVSQAITMTGDATNHIHVDMSMHIRGGTRNTDYVVALFRDTVNIGSTHIRIVEANFAIPISLILSDAPGDLVAHTYSVRVGTSGGTWYVNTPDGANLGGSVVSISTFKLTEVGL